MTRRDGIGPELRGKSLLITGGGTGIGAATAIAAARAGMQVMITGRRPGPLEQTAARIQESGGRCEIFVGDVTDEGASEAMVDAMVDRLGGVDAVFANAGYGIEKPVVESSSVEIHRIFDVNLVSAVDLLRVAARRMLDANRPGHLIGCASILGKFTMPDYGLYSSTKAALTHVCRSMRCELDGTGIAVSSVHPVTTRTEFFQVSGRESGDRHGPALRDDGMPVHAPKIFIQPPERVANAVVRCLERPRAEVWTTVIGRLASGIFELCPPVYDMVLRSQIRRRNRDSNDDRAPGASPPAG